jgi:DNA-binding NtrC family response regulator
VRVLVVDDESDVRDLVSRMLDSAGHEVVAAIGPADAERIFAEGLIDVVVTDVDMDQVRAGIALAATLRHHRPDLPIILMSGGQHEKSVPAGHRLLKKPFQRQELLDAIAGVAGGQRR